MSCAPSCPAPPPLHQAFSGWQKTGESSDERDKWAPEKAYVNSLKEEQEAAFTLLQRLVLSGPIPKKLALHLAATDEKEGETLLKSLRQAVISTQNMVWVEKNFVAALEELYPLHETEVVEVAERFFTYKTVEEALLYEIQPCEDLSGCAAKLFYRLANNHLMRARLAHYLVLSSILYNPLETLNWAVKELNVAHLSGTAVPLALAYRDLGFCYYSLFQNHQVAQWWLEKAVHTYQKNCGEQHSDTVFARLLLFFVRGSSTSSFEKAKPYFQQAIELSENKFGKNHIRTIGSYNAIGIFLLCSNRLAEAEEYFKKALGCCQTKHIPQSVFALSSYGFLLSIYERQNRDAEFEECLEKCIEISEMIYGKNHIISVRYHRRKNQMAWLKTIESYRRKVTEEKTTTHGE